MAVNDHMHSTTDSAMDDSDFTGRLFCESAERLFAGKCDKEVVNAAEEGHWPDELWNELENLGFTRAALPETQGGSGVPLAALLPVVRLAGRFSVPVPLGETLVAGWLLAGAGLPVAEGPLAFAPVDRRRPFELSRVDGDWVLDGALRNLPWGERAARIALVAESAEGTVVASVDPSLAECLPGSSLAGEPRPRLEFRETVIAPDAIAPAPPGVDADTPYLWGALLRSQQMAGALGAARDLAVRYTGERIAFGRPLNRLQAVRQNLAVLAGQAAAAEVAADMTIDALVHPDVDLEEVVALARLRINEAAEIGARLAHQAHGAIGFTYEHPLHQATRRLWAWRDEFGNDSYWAERIGRRLVEGGADRFWTTMTRISQL